MAIQAHKVLVLGALLVSVGCGSNPEKTVSGVSLKQEFLRTNQGAYRTFSQEKLRIDSAGEAVQGRVEANRLSLWLAADNQLEMTTAKGTRTRIPLPEAIRAINPRPGDQATVSFSCFYGREGTLEDFVKFPERRKGLRYDYEIEGLLNRGANYMASFQFRDFAFRGVQDLKKSGAMAESFPPEALKVEMERICRDSQPQAYEIQNSFGVIGYNGQQIEIVPGSRYHTEIYDPAHLVHQRFWVKEEVPEIDVTSRFWTTAKGLFLAASRGYNYEKSRYDEWQVTTPREELNFATETGVFTWKREESKATASCGFELIFTLKKLVVRDLPKELLGYLDSQFKFNSGRRIGDTACSIDSAIESLQRSSEGVRLMFKVREDSGNGLSVRLEDKGKDLATVEHALPWSDSARRLTPKTTRN
ncbi:MAG: hypothetical protein IT288_06500 [Bdellovibrionales bacterium]|nr:hypothetical protein [Bdellovibrionales bacterium]